VDRVAALPGIEDAAVTSQLTLGGNFDASGVNREDLPSVNPEDVPSAQRFAVSTAFLDVPRNPLSFRFCLSHLKNSSSFTFTLGGFVRGS